MCGPYIYLLIRRENNADTRAAIELLREGYGVIKFDQAPMNMGMLYQTTTPVSKLDMEVIGLVDWE